MNLLPIITATALAVTMSTSAFAAGSDSGSSSTTTETTEECEDGQVWDKKKKKCVDPEDARLDDDAIYENAREFAYDGQFDNAIRVLHLAKNQNDPRILNYLGYANRKAGRVELGMAFYKKALAQDPDYTLTRSYMGQARVLAGDLNAAKAQLAEIKKRDGINGYPYTALEASIIQAALTIDTSY